MSDNSTKSAGRSFVSSVLARMPYSHQLIQNVADLNPKYETFHKLAAHREDKIQPLSILQAQPDDDIANASVVINRDYHAFLYANLDLDKTRRVQDYRRMSAYAEVSDCIDEICDEVIVKDNNDSIVTFNLRGKHDRNIKEQITKEFNTFMNNFDLENKGWEYFRSLLIDGEVFFENIISSEHPDYGILGVTSIPTELITPIYDNVQNSIIKGYLLRKPILNKDNTGKKDKEELIAMDKNQVTYIHSGIWNDTKTIRMPYLENCKRAYKQLSLIEDSIVIYRLVRAPERLVFKIDVGNMQPQKAEAYLKRLMQQYWTKKTVDSTNGGNNSAANVYDPQSMLDSYWFAKRQGSDGSDVSVLQGGQNLGQLDDLMYFVKKLYKTLKVPLSRLEPGNVFTDGAEITREELRFARFIMRIQRQFAMGIKTSFITHLKLRNLWGSYKLKEHEVQITFNTPTNFMTLREQQIFDIKLNNYNSITSNEGIANSFAQRYYLGMADPQMAENREWLKKDAALQWEIEQIRTAGPNWREQQEAVAKAMEAEAGPAGGGAMPPEFGPGPEDGNADADGAPVDQNGQAVQQPAPGAPASVNQAMGSVGNTQTGLPGTPPTQ